MDLRRQILREGNELINTVEKILDKVEALMAIVDDSFQAAESTFLAIATDQKENHSWGKEKAESSNKTTSNVSVASKGTSKYKAHSVNELVTENGISDITEEDGVTTVVDKDTVPDMINPMTDDNKSTADTIDSIDTDLMSEYINNLVQTKLGPNEPSYCTRAMFANLKGSQKCDKDNCKYVHSEDGYKKIIKVLAEFYPK